ncbi:MAG: S1 RNA-binding domain-containing protein [Elusimicrobiota bacterium]|jgi:ribosomal protein S1|nr:S1 RNA-binding domain-containing protein [Elusimicrobiota bacterium]
MTNAEENQTEQTTQTQNEDMTMDQLFAQQEEMQQKLNKREIVNVAVVQISADNVLVDTGDKKEGLIPLSDFEGKAVPEVGAVVPAVLIRKGGDERHSVLSHKKALESMGWDLCKTAYENKERVKSAVLDCVKGGYKIDVNGVIGFMPLSLSELHAAYKHYLPKGAKIKAVIVEFSKEKQKLIVSRRQVLEEDEAIRRAQVLSEVKIGDVLRAVVSKVGKDALFLRFHGIEGAVSLDNIAWKDAPAILAGYRRGQRVKAKLLAIDGENGAMTFGIKQLFMNPADLLRKRFAYMSPAKGVIVKITPEGIEVKLGKNDAKGFIPAVELPLDFAGKEGENVQSVVIGIDAANFTVNLSVRRFEQVQNRKVVAQYLKQAPRPTLGQLLQNSFGEEEEEDAAEEAATPEPAEEAAAPAAEAAKPAPQEQEPAAEDKADAAAVSSEEETSK